MTTKFGQCPLCPKGSPEVRIYGIGVCAYHLAHPEDDQSKERKVRTAPGAHKTVLLNQFFKEMALHIPARCENCGKQLPRGSIDNWQVRATMCHIVPKRYFESVMVHPDNIWFGCQQCHDRYDLTWTAAVKMKVWPVVVERFQRFMTLIKDTELSHLPDALRTFIELNPPK
jgi:5-methylcytosine-specific restriction endonuclease McrA